MSLFDASVDLNPHQIEAALFAMNNPLSKGVILADEVGLGKTIEAALVLCQLWAERKRNLLIICPASLRKQWANELEEKFNLPTQILDTKTYKRKQKEGLYTPLRNNCITIVSYFFPLKMEEAFVSVPWDLVVLDEAHKLRNAYKNSHKIGKMIRQIFGQRKKLLLTATPLQNSLMELYGLSSIIDEHIFGDEKSFRKQFVHSEASLSDLSERLSAFIKRTLRKHVLEYVKYTERTAITVPFTPTDEEHHLYTEVSEFLSREDTYALPSQQKHLTALIARKLLASSSHAIINNLQKTKSRLEYIRDNDEEKIHDENFLETLIEDDDIETDYLEEDEIVVEEDGIARRKFEKLDEEITLLEKFVSDAKALSYDTKAQALLKAIETGFSHMASVVNRDNERAPRKAIVFTESKRTQEYLETFLSQNGYEGKVATFNGSNQGPQATKIYQDWQAKNEGSDRMTGSSPIDRRTAIIDYFRDEAEILIATEAASEGINLQFCALIINYDLPWNPQRIEQRIGRCHRYGQKFDVVVINFLNKRNQADQRVLELLTEKFKLFDGIFGASDEVLGSIENGIDFEKAIAKIYATYRTTQEIDQAFARLQERLEESINEGMRETKRILIENFDEDVHDLFKAKLDEAENRLDKIGRYFWRVTQYMLLDDAIFHDDYAFTLKKSFDSEIALGLYQLIRKGKAKALEHAHKYRLTHPLGERVLADAKKLETPSAEVTFDYSGHISKISVVEDLVGCSGWLTLKKLHIESLQSEDHLIFTGMKDDGVMLDAESCEKFFSCDGTVSSAGVSDAIPVPLIQNAKRQVEAKISSLLEENNRFFEAEREKLEKWADDKMMSAEQILEDTKKNLRFLKRESRTAETLEKQKNLQEEIRDTERRQRRLRQQIFETEDEIIEKRDKLIEALEQKLQQTTHVDDLFVIRWKVV